MTEEERDPELVRLRSKLADAIETLNEGWDSIPDGWFSMKELVSGMTFTPDEWTNALGMMRFVYDTSKGLN